MASAEPRFVQRRRTRVGLGVALALVVATVVGVGVYMVADVARLNREVQEVHQRSMRDLDLIGELQYQTQEARRSVLYALGTADSNQQVEYADESRAAEGRASALAQQLRYGSPSPEISDLLARFQSSWTTYLIVRDEVLALILEGGSQAAIQLDLARGKDEFNRARAILTELKTVLRAEAASRVAKAHAGADRSLGQLGGTLALTLVFAAAAVAMVFRLARIAAAQDSERRMREVVESISEAMVVLDSSDRVTLWNQPAEELFGVARSAAMGRPLAEVIPDLAGTPVPARIEAAVTQQKMQSIAELALGSGSSAHIYETRIFPFERGVTLFFTNITERKKAEENRRGLERKLLESQKLESLGVLSGGVAHDFNNLLTAIMGNASLAASDLPPNSQVQEFIRQIQQASKQASNLCQQMLAYAGRGRFHVETVDLNGLIHELSPLLRVSVPKHIDLQLELGPFVPAATLDTTQVKQVLLNLVINAAEAINERGGRIVVRTRVWPERSGVATPADDFVLPPSWPAPNYASLEVEDDGCGMTAETRAKIFDPFFTTKFTGRGLGLAAVLGILRGHRGALRLESAPGRGTKFVCYFPAALSTADAPGELSLPSAPWKGSGKALVVDDEAQVRNVVGNMVRIAGFEPVLGCDGQDGVDIFRSSPYDFAVVILDLTMPRLNGHEALDQMLALRPDLPAIVISGFSEKEINARVSARPQTVVMQKPFEAEDLRERLRVLLTSSAPQVSLSVARQGLAAATEA